MASWFTVYCTRTVSHVTAADLLTALTAVDFATVAEGFGIECEAEVEQAVSRLRVEASEGEAGIRFRVYHRPPRYRPLIVHHWTEAGRIRQEREEPEENYLAGRSGRGVSLVRRTLSRTLEVAAVELSLARRADMGLVIAGQLAEYLAGVGKGPIRDPGDEWWLVRGGVPRLLVGSG